MKRLSSHSLLVRCLSWGLIEFVTSALTAAESHRLLHNFTAPLPSTDAVTTSVDSEHPQVGLSSARCEYHLDAKSRKATLPMPDRKFTFSGPGLLKLWVKGDASINQLQLGLRHGVFATDTQGRRIVQNMQQLDLPVVSLTSDQWQQVTFDVRKIPAGNTAWWNDLRFIAPQPPKPAKPKPGEAPPVEKPQVMDGVVLIDDFTFKPDGVALTSTFSLSLIGPPARTLTNDVSWSADLRSFVNRPTKSSLRLTVTDRDDNVVVDRNFALDLAANESKEARLELAPENLQLYLPPFKVSGDLISADLNELNGKLDDTIVLGNSYLLFDNMADVFGRWFTSGIEGFNNAYTAGAGQRSYPLTQIASKIERVLIEPSSNQAQPLPESRYALKWDYAGNAMVFTGFDRYLPGNAYRLGVWVKGDGSSSKLHALTLDYTDLGDFYEGGWKRIRNGEKLVCVLDFTGWKYFEYDLPGLGIGSNEPTGSTDELDFPLELSGFRIEAAQVDKVPQSGSVQIGPIFTRTQQAFADTLVVHLGYDDPDHSYAADRKAWCTVQNAWTTGSRKLKLRWTLTDRDDKPVASEPFEADVAGTKQQTFAIDLARHQAAITARPFPMQLQVEAYVADDATIAASRQLVLTRPDSSFMLADFETDRGYLGLKARDLADAPGVGELAAFTTTDEKHGQERSLAIEWSKEKSRRFISIDPPLAGVPTELSMWVHGDGSGALFYPLFGDRRGVRHGLATSQYDLFLARNVDGPLQNAVRVDWKGWREVKFRLPPVPPNWKKDLPILGYLPSYPLGLHLCIDAKSATTELGKICVDDIRVVTHLPNEERLAATIVKADQTNVVAPGGNLAVAVVNRDASQPVKATLVTSISDWRGRKVAGGEKSLELKPGEQQRAVVAEKLPDGVFSLQVQLAANGQTRTTLNDDLLVANLQGQLGDEWKAALTDEWRLRQAIGDKFTMLDEDWDWVEHFPGNVQVDSIRTRASEVTKNGADPFVLLGYSAYWAAEDGYKQLLTDSFLRPQRDIGHAVGIFMSPARMEDWDNYMHEVMRGAGRDVRGWVLWDNPAGNGPLRLEPAKLAEMAAIADKWRKIYCPEVPLLIGGMGRQGAAQYLVQLAEHKALDHISGVNVRLDVGQMSPEDARVPNYLRELKSALRTGEKASNNKTERTILLTDLDWAVEKGDAGLNAFDQAAYLIRSDLLMHQLGLRSALSVRNEDAQRLGVGLSYRQELTIPPLKEKLLTYQLKPAYWGIVRTREWLDKLAPLGEVDIQDVIPGRTRCLVYERKTDKAPVAILWRNNDAGFVSLSETGLKVTAAEDLLGSQVAAENDAYPVGKLPIVLVLSAGSEPALQAVARLRVRDGRAATWPQQVLAAFAPVEGGRQSYSQSGGVAATLSGVTVTGEKLDWTGLRFPKDGREQFTVAVPSGAGLVLKKRFLLEPAGEQAEILVNGQSAGKWDLRPSDSSLSLGLREATFVVDSKLLAGKTQAAIEIRYQGSASSAGWVVLENRDKEYPLSALAPLHADQNIGHLRLARNVVGEKLKVGAEPFAGGIGVMAKSLIEYPLGGQFARFTTQVGIDAATEGRGSVAFEIYADGKRVWTSGLVSGLDQPKKVDLSVAGVQRLRLVVTDGGDGNKFDAADWCEPVLHRD